MRKGTKHSEETRRKMQIKAVGRIPPNRKGAKMPTEVVEKLRILFRGKPRNGDPVSWKHTSETRKKMSISRKGAKAYQWKGGVTPINERIRKSFEYSEWRNSVFERDDYTCQECGLTSGNGRAVVLHADHIKPFALYPELRFDLNNGRTLCVDCHRRTDTYGYRKSYIQIA